jgi:hypothetical protein
VNSRNVRVSLNRPNGMKEVSKAFGEDVEQLGGGHQAPNLPVLRNNVPRNEAPKTLRRAVILWATQTQCERGLAPDSSVSVSLAVAETPPSRASPLPHF